MQILIRNAFTDAELITSVPQHPVRFVKSSDKKIHFRVSHNKTLLTTIKCNWKQKIKNMNYLHLITGCLSA